jgi:hypothetical protein
MLAFDSMAKNILVLLLGFGFTHVAQAFQDCQRVLSLMEAEGEAGKLYSQFYDAQGRVQRDQVQKRALEAKSNQRAMSFVLQDKGEIIGERRYQARGKNDFLISLTTKRDDDQRLMTLTLSEREMRHKLNIGVGPETKRSYKFHYQGDQCLVVRVEDSRNPEFHYQSCFELQKVLRSPEECLVGSACHRQVDGPLGRLIGDETLSNKPELVTADYKKSVSYVFNKRCSYYEQYVDLESKPASPVKKASPKKAAQ